MTFERIESDIDSKLLFKFDPEAFRVEIVTRRYHKSTGRLNFKETIPLLEHVPPIVAAVVQQMQQVAALRGTAALSGYLAAGSALLQ